MTALNTQLFASRGYAAWLTSTLPEQSDESKDFSDSLLHALQIYEWEIERQLDGIAATKNWFELIALTSTMAALLRDELLEHEPALADYRVADEPKTLHEMPIRLLHDAITLFEMSCAEMRSRFEMPRAAVEIRGLIERVWTATETQHV